MRRDLFETYLQQLPGEILSFIESVQVIDEFLARHLLPDILWGMRNIYWAVNGTDLTLRVRHDLTPLTAAEEGISDQFMLISQHALL